MKAVILAAGHGTRMRPYTFSKPKHMLPVANKPVMQYLVEALEKVGIRDILMVVGHLQESIREYFGDGSKFGVSIEYIEQKEKKGLAHAVAHAEEFVDGEPFMVLLGDVLFTSNLDELVRKHENAEASLALVRVEDPSAFGVVEIEGNKIKKLVEKPKEPPSNLAIAGIYFFSSGKIFDIIRNLKPSKRGEYEITDAVQGLIDSGFAVNGIVLEKWWKDTGNPKDLLETNKAVLDELFEGQEEKVLIGKNCKISDSTLIEGQCIIGNNCEIMKSKIGPYTCIQDNCKIENSVVGNTILMENSEVINMNLANSVIGSKSILKADEREKRQHTYYIGDKSQVDIVRE